MFDTSIRRRIDPLLDRVAAWLVRRGCTANVVTVVGFLIGAMACLAIGFQQYLVALLLITMNRVADGIDGAIARQSRATDVGGFLDIVLDTIFYSGVPFAFAVSRPHDRLPAAFLIYSFIGTGGSFLAYATIAAKRGVTADREQKKSFYYSVGLMEGAETIVFFILFCVLPEHFAALAWTFGSLCWVTTILRIIAGVTTFRESVPDDVP